MTKKELKIISKYAKITNIPRKVVRKVYEHGDTTQREIDRVAMEATIYLKEQQQLGNIKTDDKGKIDRNQADELVQKFIKEKYKDVKHMPVFFSKQLPIRMIEKSSPEISKADVTLEPSPTPESTVNSEKTISQ